MLWSRPYLFLVLCTCAYYLVRSRRVLAEAQHKRAYEAFFQERCDAAGRWAVGRGLLLSIPNGTSALSWLMLLAMLRLGGAGSLFWYAVFSLLWLKPLEALATLDAYYRAPGVRGLQLGGLLRGMRARKGAVPGRRLAALLGVVQAALLCCLMSPAVLLPIRAARGGEAVRAAVCLGAAAVLWLLCRAGGERAGAALSALFLAFLGVALALNLANIIPAVKLSLRDAFQCNTFLFALSGAGFQQALRGGARMAAGTLGMEGLAGAGEEPVLSHPVCHGLQVRLQADLGLAIQLILGVLFLCAQMVPQGNRWIQTVLWGFLCLFGIELFARTLGRLRRAGRRGRVLAGLCVPAVWLVALLPGRELFAGVLWGVSWAVSLCILGLLLYDSGWYFALLEDFRDVYLWRVEPHPRISRRHTKP